MGGFSAVAVTKAPFWSAVITRTYGSVSAPSATHTYVTIQPPAGETWWITISGTIYADSGYYLAIGFIDNAGSWHQDLWRYPTASPGYGHYDHYQYAQLPTIITNTTYFRIRFYQNTGQAVEARYTYSGFKLSKPLWSPRKLNPEPKPFKLPTTLPLPDPLKPLDGYRAMILGLDPERIDEYALGIVLEEDTPLAVDPATGFPVERLSVYVKADVLADMIAKFKAGALDPDKAGYRKYLDKWKAEGVDFGV